MDPPAPSLNSDEPPTIGHAQTEEEVDTSAVDAPADASSMLPSKHQLDLSSPHQLSLSLCDKPQQQRAPLVLQLQHPEQQQGTHHGRGLHLGEPSLNDSHSVDKKQRGNNTLDGISTWSRSNTQASQPSHRTDDTWADRSKRSNMGPPATSGSGLRANLTPAAGGGGVGQTAGRESMIMDAVSRLPDATLEILLMSELQQREQRQVEQERRRSQDQQLMSQLQAMQGVKDASRGRRDNRDPSPLSQGTQQQQQLQGSGAAASAQTITVDVATLTQFLQEATGMLHQQQRAPQDGGSGPDLNPSGGSGSRQRHHYNNNPNNNGSQGNINNSHNGGDNGRNNNHSQQQQNGPSPMHARNGGRSMHELSGNLQNSNGQGNQGQQQQQVGSGGGQGGYPITRPLVSHSDLNNSRRMIVAKFMTRSDAQTKRLILPRAQLERNMPEVMSSPHHTFSILDDFGETWSFVIRAWPNGNNPKPVYVLEHISEVSAQHCPDKGWKGTLLPGLMLRCQISQQIWRENDSRPQCFAILCRNLL